MDDFLRHFQLNQAQACTLLEGVAGEALASCTLAPTPAAAPPEADTRLVTFRYTTQRGETRDATVFVKRCVWKGKSEAVHYHHFAAAGVPTPRLYGATRNANDAEIIFLEPVTSFGFHPHRETEWRAMLSLLARLNACPVKANYAAHLHPFEQVGQLEGGLWITGLPADLDETDVETTLQAVGVGAETRPAFTRAARAVFQALRAQPRGLLHQDFLSDNFGRCDGHPGMVVFDLHKNSLGPRFADVAPYLGAPDWSACAPFLDDPPDDPPGGARTRREALSQHYLDEYARFGGGRVGIETFRAETSALVWAHKITVLPSLAEHGQRARIAQVTRFLEQAAV